jgi:predicted RNase H-like HicB family nuclease
LLHDEDETGRTKRAALTRTPRGDISVVVRIRYTVVLDREEDGRVIASVPGVPGCHVHGRTPREAVAKARKALQFYVDALKEDGRLRPA